MPQLIKVLVVEDSPTDAELLIHELRRAGFEPEWVRVDTEAAMSERLSDGFDLVLSDFLMPQFDGFRALELIGEKGLETPFILVSGTIGEETAVEAMKRGASDYLLKDRLGRLGSAVAQALTRRRLRAERRESEHARIQAETKYRHIFENSAEGLYQARPDGGLIVANATLARIAGYDSVESLVAEIRDGIDGLFARAEDRGKFRARLTETGVVRGFETQLRRRDGGIVWISCHARLIRDETGAVCHEGAWQDITERKQLEGQFLRAQRLEAIGTLASGIAHDLNNILTPMLMVVALLREKVAGTHDAELLQIVQQGAQRGANIIKQLLTFSRGIDGERGPVQPRHLLKDMAGIMRETFPREITIAENLAADLWLINADATQIHQVLMNLCVNARDAMSAGGTLTIAAENVHVTAEQVVVHPGVAAGPFVRLTISDTGEGIPAENLDRIFEPFFTTKETGKGTGLGLSSVAGIVKSHRGFITVESEVGRGSVFQAHLPAEIGGGEATAAAEGVLPAGKDELILVVDDEESIRHTLSLVLERSGFRVLAVADGHEAERVFREHRANIRLVLTDIMMPGMNGMELIRRLRTLSPRLSIIASSGLNDRERTERLAEMGVSTFLVKPSSLAMILAAVQHELAGGAPSGRP